ncbi:MAG: hypothetical protein ABIT20_16685 [Gemmatimonadaceae bacterium]
MFSGAHLHLLVNHVPIIGAFFALALLAASYLFAPDVLRKTAFVALIVVAFAGLASDLTGEPAEKVIDGFPGVSRDVIHAHEDMAERAYLIGGVVGVLALGGLLRWRRTPVPAGAALVMLLGTAFLSGAMAYTGLLGGRVRHTEVRPGSVPADAMTIEPPRVRRPDG